MNKLIQKVDIAYLPKVTPDTILDDINLDDLNQGYKFARTYDARAYCSYHYLVPFIESENYTTTIAQVIDFPNGEKSSEEKLIQIGQAYEIGKKASNSEIDFVLCPSFSEAVKDLFSLTSGNVHKMMGIKVIVELGVRLQEDIINLLKYFDKDQMKDAVTKINYIKTNSGRHNSPTFDEKIKQVKWLRQQTKLPLKISGGVGSWKEIEDYIEIAGETTIFGVSYDKIKDWK